MTGPRSKRTRSRYALWPTLVVAIFAALPAAAAEPTAEQLDFFEKEVRPLLVKRCYECHSGDGAQEGELRLDHRSLILKGGATGPAAVAGRPKESLLVEAVQYRGFQMPPDGKLPEAEINTLVRWVELGMPWPDEPAPSLGAAPVKAAYAITPRQRAHWAFQPLSNPAPPAVADGTWPAGDIDRFVLAKMEAHGLAPAAPADRRTLLRRVTFDLTGLPPTPQEIGEFLADASPGAWDRVVDRLLASRQYGEKWGRHWLDVVRYADTAGDASDYPLPDAYKYRDYVIDSFNADKPFDRFLREQYAGDLFAAEAPPERFAELTIATTHVALSRRFGYNDTNFHYPHLTIADTLDTMGQAVLGLSIGCARCHDHKFEPISARDYYALYGIFSSTKFTFPGAEEVPRPKHLVPLVPPAEAARLNSERAAELAAFDAAIEAAQEGLLAGDGGFERQAAGKPVQAPWKADDKSLVAPEAQSPFVNVYPAGRQGIRFPNAPANLGILRPVPTPAAGSTLHANLDLRNVGVESGGDGYYRVCLCHRQNYSPAFEIVVNGSHLAVRRGAELTVIAPVAPGTWYNLQLSLNVAAKTFSGVLSDGRTSWPIGETPTLAGWDGVADAFLVDAHPPDAGVRPAREFDNIAVAATPFPPAGESNAAPDTLAAGWAKATEEIAALRAQRDALARQPVYPTAYAVAEGTPANARLQKRGELERPGEEVPRGFLEILGGQRLPETVRESGRRELAGWLTDPANPLTPRVIANRVWQYHFGRGIVPTPNDFGVRGKPPTHPELLDHLAARFIGAGWSFKTLHREILRSRTYQQSGLAESPPDDPGNVWLSHFPRRRLGAEELRDSLLVLAGELDPSPGGPHPFPPVETWAFTQHNAFKAVYDSRRRSVYLMTQRIKKHPFLGLFDGADPNATTAERTLTTTPAQALYVMNDEWFHARAQAVSARLAAAAPDEGERLRLLYESAYAREPSPDEREEAKQFLDAYRQTLPDPAASGPAAWAAYIRVILSSNEFLHVD